MRAAVRLLRGARGERARRGRLEMHRAGRPHLPPACEAGASKLKSQPRVCPLHLALLQARDVVLTAAERFVMQLLRAWQLPQEQPAKRASSGRGEQERRQTERQADACGDCLSSCGTPHCFHEGDEPGPGGIDPGLLALQGLLLDSVVLALASLRGAGAAEAEQLLHGLAGRLRPAAAQLAARRSCCICQRASQALLDALGDAVC